MKANEIKELLEESKNWALNGDMWQSIHCINQALAALEQEQPVCEKCGGSGKVEITCHQCIESPCGGKGNCERPCDCQKPAETDTLHMQIMRAVIEQSRNLLIEYTSNVDDWEVKACVNNINNILTSKKAGEK